MSAFNVEIFLDNLNVKLNETKLNNIMPVDDYYKKFYNTFKKGADKYVHLKKNNQKRIV